jgi:inhibitor of cysteine peptidase
VGQILTQADSGRNIELHVGDAVVLRLPERASTGYRWEIEAADTTLVDAQEGQYAAASSAVGGGGETQWTLRARATGIAYIRLKRWRRWEGEDSVRERFEVTLRIVP